MTTQLINALQKEIKSLRGAESYFRVNTFIAYPKAIGCGTDGKKHYKGFAKKRILDAQEGSVITLFCTTKSYGQSGGQDYIVKCVKEDTFIIASNECRY